MRASHRGSAESLALPTTSFEQGLYTQSCLCLKIDENPRKGGFLSLSFPFEPSPKHPEMAKEGGVPFVSLKPPTQRPTKTVL